MKSPQLKLKTYMLPVVLTASFAASPAFADNETADSLDPTMFFNDSDSVGSDIDNVDWKIIATDELYQIIDDTNDDLATNDTVVIKIEALGNYAGHAKITSAQTSNSIKIEDSGNIGFAGNTFYLKKVTDANQFGMGTVTPDTGIHIKSTDVQWLQFENTAESTWRMGQSDQNGSSSSRDGDFQFNIASNGNGGSTGAAMTIRDDNGRVGIGTEFPDAQLHIFGAATQDVFAGMGVDLNSGPSFNYGYAGASFGEGAGFFNVRPLPGGDSGMNPSLRFATKNVQRMVIANSGNIGIGDIGGGFIPSEDLHVEGNIRTDGNFIASGTTLNVPDYVFEDDYNLMSLTDLKAYITKENHLPGVKSAKEVAEEGLNLSLSQMALLEKVEELTLYKLSQQDELNSKEKMLANQIQLIESQEKQIADQHLRLAKLESVMTSYIKVSK